MDITIVQVWSTKEASWHPSDFISLYVVHSSRFRILGGCNRSNVCLQAMRRRLHCACRWCSGRRNPWSAKCSNDLNCHSPKNTKSDSHILSCTGYCTQISLNVLVPGVSCRFWWPIKLCCRKLLARCLGRGVINLGRKHS